METRKLSLKEMEMVEGGWDWNATGCMVGAAVVGGLIGAFTLGLGIGVGIFMGTMCQMGSEYGWDN